MGIGGLWPYIDLSSNEVLAQVFLGIVGYREELKLGLRVFGRDP